MSKQLEQQIKSLDLKQNAIKILINSFYGAFGNKYFYFHNNEIAQSITLQGQDLIKFSIKAINHYFQQKWHLDTELHEKLGISGKTINQIEKQASFVYLHQILPLTRDQIKELLPETGDRIVDELVKALQKVNMEVPATWQKVRKRARNKA